MIFKILLPVISMLIFITGCTAGQPKPEPPDVSGVDVPMLLLQRQAYVSPKDASNDAFFAAHSENKGVSKLQDFQMGLITALMELSSNSGKPIKIHGAPENAHQ
jgi:hypothetical protein